MALLTPLFGADANLVAHEWGTFTSVAGVDGDAMAWATLSGAPDLPCFVEHVTGVSPKLSAALERMETPVLYFYPREAMSVDVHVDFPQGWVSEWYPHASRVWRTPATPERAEEISRGGGIAWDAVQLLPGESPALPSSSGASRYYAARNTDAAPLRVGDQNEKLIFYRGVGDFAIPLRASFDSAGALAVNNTGPDQIALAVLFENHGGKIGYRVVRSIQGLTAIETSGLTGDQAALERELAADLEEFGLYPKEAQAMVATWRDSWFEEGMRLLYIVPRAMVDSVLPLTITPVPDSTVRVFVGRIEILSPAVASTIETAVASHDRATLARFGRFLDPFLFQLRTLGKNLAPVALPGSKARCIQ